METFELKKIRLEPDSAQNVRAKGNPAQAILGSARLKTSEL
jgi:hypothetical protein